MLHRSRPLALVLGALASTAACDDVADPPVDDPADTTGSSTAATTGGHTPDPDPTAVEWPSGPGATTAPAACVVDGSRSLQTYAPDPATLSLTPRADGTVRVVTTGWIEDGDATLRGRIMTHVDVLPWEVPGSALGGGYSDDVATAASDALLPFATRGDVTVHVHEGEVSQLRARVLSYDDEQQHLRSESNRWHDLPAEQARVQAVTLLDDRVALIAHGAADDMRFSSVAFSQDEPYPAAIVQSLPSPRACADRPVVVTLAPVGERTLIAASTDGTSCGREAAAPDAVVTAMVDDRGVVVAESTMRVGGVVDALWSASSGQGTWIAIRVEGEAGLRIGRVGADAVLQPVATVPAAEKVAITAWGDGLAIADMHVLDGLRVRLVDGEGAVADAGVTSAVALPGSQPAIVASPDGRTLLVGAYMKWMHVQDGPEAQLLYVDCAL